MTLNETEVRQGGNKDDLYLHRDLWYYVLLGQRSRT